MGGHGGLNILPQKRWNVYGQKNRLKVHEDEVKAAEEEKAQQEKQEKAEREFKTNLLRKRTRTGGQERLEHINLFEEEERNQQNAEVKREREMEDRKRGRKSDRTSDAKFDERFAFIHGLNDSKPWYARPAMRFTEQPKEKAAAQKPQKTLDDDEKSSKKSKKDKKRKKARALLKELRRSNFKKSEIDVAMLRIERLRREKKEEVRAQRICDD